MKNLFSSISPRIYERFLSKEREALLFVTRTHWITILPQLFFLSFLTIIAGVIIISALFFFTLPLQFVLPSLLLLLMTSSLVGWYTLVSWYYHLYIVTTGKILEYRYIPLFTHVLNDVLLDQVRCTEIDIAKNGFVAELFDMGTITITFDRPTHQEEFALTGIQHPEKIGMLLGDNLYPTKRRNMTTIWHKDDQSKKFQLLEEIPPPGSRVDSDLIGVDKTFSL